MKTTKQNTTSKTPLLEEACEAQKAPLLGRGWGRPLFLLLFIIGLSTANAQVGIGTTTPDQSSILDLTATDKGLLPPRLSDLQRNAITSPAEGLTIYSTDSKCLETYNGTNWINLCDGNPTNGDSGNSCDPANNPTTVVEVQAAGYTWMDRNLGASRAAIASDDFKAYGSLYQWGRSSDGHECINWTSSTGSDGAEQNNESTSQSTSPNPGSTFITGFSNWYNGTNPDDLWKPDLTGENNPCPAGYRVPSDTELTDLGITNAGNAYSSIGLTMAGRRLFSDGSLSNVGIFGNYWTSIITNSFEFSRYIFFSNSNAGVDGARRARGYSVRCLRD